MTRSTSARDTAARSRWTASRRQRPRARILVVALEAEALERLPRHVLDPEAELIHGAPAEVAGMSLAGAEAPDLILSPLLAKGFDAVDLLATLRRAGFAGRYLILAPPLSHLALIRAEIQALAPGVNVDIIALDGGSVLHGV